MSTTQIRKSGFILVTHIPGEVFNGALVMMWLTHRLASWVSITADTVRIIVAYRFSICLI